jgi:hypothetical protein
VKCNNLIGVERKVYTKTAHVHPFMPRRNHLSLSKRAAKKI